MIEFSGNESYHPYSPAHIVHYNWAILGTTYTDQQTVSVFVDRDDTATLTVEDNYGCTDTDTITLLGAPQEVPLITPAGMVALIGILCIIGVGRIAKKR
jgi:hypothetical protein